MRREGFADDGLFDKMKIFFLPLTMVEKDIDISDDQWTRLSRNLLEEKQRLSVERNRSYTKLEILENHYYDLEESIAKLENPVRPAAQPSERNASVQEQMSVQQQIDNHRLERHNLEPQRSAMRAHIDQINNMLLNIERSLTVRENTHSNRDLIKPNRGFIMYGPPGTYTRDSTCCNA